MIGADGSLTGFGGGLAWKQWLLDREQPQGTFLACAVCGTVTGRAVGFAC